MMIGRGMTVAMKALIVSVLLMSSAITAHAGDTTTYAYDAKRRLVQLLKSGTVNNGVTTEYSHDQADNRTRVKVSDR